MHRNCRDIQTGK